LPKVWSQHTAARGMAAKASSVVIGRLMAVSVNAPLQAAGSLRGTR
jgi:hypothetical protein